MSKPIKLTKKDGAELWVHANDVARVEDFHALLPEHSRTVVTLKDGSWRDLPAESADATVALLWPEPKAGDPDPEEFEYAVDLIHDKTGRQEPFNAEDWRTLKEAQEWLEHDERYWKGLGFTAKIVRRRKPGPVEDLDGTIVDI